MPLLSIVVQLVSSFAAVFVPILLPGRIFSKQVGGYRILVVYIFSLVGALLCFLLLHDDFSLSFTRVFIFSGLMTLVSLISEVRAANLLILARSEFIHKTVDEILKVDEIVNNPPRMPKRESKND